MRKQHWLPRRGLLARPAALRASVQQEAAPRTVDTSEAVLYTTIAAVHRHHRQGLVIDSLPEPGAGFATCSRRILPPYVWQPISSSAWVQVHICVEMDRYTSEARFRIVVWILESGRVVVNDILGVGCRWWRSSCDDTAFRRLTSVDGHSYGFQFRCVTKAIECSRIIDHILANIPGVMKVVQKLMRANVDLRSLVMAWQGFGLHSIHYPSRVPRVYSETTPVSPTSPCSEPSAGRRTIYPRAQDDSLPRREEQQQEDADFGELQHSTDCASGTASSREANNLSAILGPEDDPSVAGEGANNQADDQSGGMLTSPVALLETGGAMNTDSWLSPLKKRGECISLPYKTRKEIHVTYNAKHARYEGLPDMWRTLNQQFGLPLEDVPKREVQGYETKVPAVLEMMKACFLAHNGARTEGVFRLAPDKNEYTAVKTSINNGAFEDCTDVHIMASLIKVWFRELPVSLFNTIPQEQISLTCELVDPEPTLVLQALTMLPLQHQSVVLWLLDLLGEIVKYERENKMTAKSMAIVMAPNLLHVESVDAAVVVAAYRQVADFVQVLLHARLAQRSAR